MASPADALALKQYPQMGWALSDPELGPILRQAAAEGWDANRLQGAIYGTNWWKQSNEAQRQWENLTNTDPAQAANLRNQKAADIAATAGTMGVTLPGEMVNSMADAALRYGWNDNQLKAQITLNYRYAGNGSIGGAATIRNQYVDLARQYFVPISDPTMAQWIQSTLSGQQNAASFTGYLEGMAKSRFAYDQNVTRAIDQGIAPETYFAPYKQEIAKLLEVAPESIDFNDPRYSKVLDTTDPNGLRRTMTLSEATSYARSLPAWQTTNNAQQTAAQTADKILSTFGKVNSSASSGTVTG
jgi:hypothetical protein